MNWAVIAYTTIVLLLGAVLLNIIVNGEIETRHYRALMDAIKHAEARQ